MMIPVLAVSNRPEMLSALFPTDVPLNLVEFDRNSKSKVKSLMPVMLVLDFIDTEFSPRDVNKLLKNLPLNNKPYTIILSNASTDKLETLQVNECICSYQLFAEQRDRLVSLLDLLMVNNQQLTQAKAQTELLLSINHFAHFKTPWQTLQSDFAFGLANFSNATVTLLFDNKKELLTELVIKGNSSSGLGDTAVKRLKNEILAASKLTQPNVNLLVDPSLQSLLLADTGKEIEAILTFPLVVYDQIIQTVVCLIDKEQMCKISVQQIDIMKQAAIQLTILIERRVAENKLKSQYQRLKNALQELQATKEQLVHSEKMAAVGKLAAGIAHEINNPLSYVLGNLEPLDDYVETIVKLLSMHDELLDNLDETINEQSQALRHKIQLEQQEEDLDFVLGDIKAIVDNSKDGLLRVRDIINDLSSFSRQQPLELQTFELNELLQETVRLLKYELSNGIDIHVKEELKFEMTAHRGFIQQVMTNLVKNAINALQGAAIDSGQITLSYELCNEEIRIKVNDNGPGVPESIQKSIFTPFFTTKGVGEGTGLGLSVSYNLAKKMGGSLQLHSAKGDTSFILTLPR